MRRSKHRRICSLSTKFHPQKNRMKKFLSARSYNPKLKQFYSTQTHLTNLQSFVPFVLPPSVSFVVKITNVHPTLIFVKL
jgi:hypothetical protein